MSAFFSVYELHRGILFVFHSAILYLNGDFEGGEFIFTKMDAKTITV